MKYDMSYRIWWTDYRGNKSNDVFDISRKGKYPTCDEMIAAVKARFPTAFTGMQYNQITAGLSGERVEQ